MGTPEFSVPALRELYSKYGIVAVYTQPDKPVGRGLELKPTPVKALALSLGIPVHQPNKMTDPREFEKLAALKPDVIVVAAYGQILKKNVLELPRLGCVNIHSSLLPRWRGAAPIQWAILAGDKVTGITTMKMAEKLDAGDLYLTRETPISSDDTAETVHDRLSEIGSHLIIETVEQLNAGSLVGKKQDESLVTYAHKLTKEMETINPSRAAREIDQQIRGLTPWPGTSVYLESGERLKVKKAKLDLSHSLKVGELNNVRGKLYLGCESGCVELVMVQPDGKKPMSGADYMNGLGGQGKSFPLRAKIS